MKGYKNMKDYKNLYSFISIPLAVASMCLKELNFLPTLFGASIVIISGINIVKLCHSGHSNRFEWAVYFFLAFLGIYVFFSSFWYDLGQHRITGL